MRLIYHRHIAHLLSQSVAIVAPWLPKLVVFSMRTILSIEKKSDLRSKAVRKKDSASRVHSLMILNDAHRKMDRTPKQNFLPT